jgi:hypothetical protein
MRTYWKWAVVLVVPAVWVAAVEAAERPVPSGTTIKLLLLRQKSVQQELEIGPDEVKKIMEFTTAESAAAHKASEMGEALSKEAHERLERLNQQFLTTTLNAKQSQRLDQITMQFAALTLLTKPEVARALSLSEEQQQKLKDLQKEARKELEDVLDTADRAARTEKFAKLREETRTKILALLTDEQQAKVREMAGPPFKGEIVFEEPESPSDK